MADPDLMDFDEFRGHFVGRVIVFNSKIEDFEDYSEPKMKARLVSATNLPDSRGRTEDDMFRLELNYEEFEEHNARFESCNYYDVHGSPCLNARQAGMYRKIDNLYITRRRSLLPFDLAASATAMHPEIMFQGLEILRNTLESISADCADSVAALAAEDGLRRFYALGKDT